MGKTSWQVKNRYNEKAYDKIYITVLQGNKDRIKAHAEKNGESINRYINRLIDSDLKNFKGGT